MNITRKEEVIESKFDQLLPGVRMFAQLEGEESGVKNGSFPGQQELKDWDNNKDRAITVREFIENATRESMVRQFDITGDGFITEAEMAEAMFTVCDKNYDNQVRGMEFYLWEVYRR